MRQFLFSILATLAVGLASATTPDADTTGATTVTPVLTTADTTGIITTPAYVRRLERFKNAWLSLIPKGSKLQFAGNMGMFSIGPTWIHGKKRHWETSILFGLIPKHSSTCAKATVTFKEDYIPWTVTLPGRFQYIKFKPLATGIYLNTVLSNEFWANLPKKYPNGYYWFATRLRPNIYIGERLEFNIPERHRVFAHSVSLFYEISSCDYYIIQRIHNKHFSPEKFLTLSFGLQLEWM